MATIARAASAVGSEVFSIIALLVLSGIVLLVLRLYLPLRTTPAYLLVPIFAALWLPASIVLLVPIDLASNARDEDVGSRGIWLPERVLLVSWRISYWLTFALGWFILPILAEYADAGYRDPSSRLRYALRANAQYYAIVFGVSIAGGIYFLVSSGLSFTSLKGVVMALAYCWALVLAIYLMGHGLVAIPRSFFRNASLSGRLRRIQTKAVKIHDKMEDAIQKFEDFEAQVLELSQRKTGSAKEFEDWIEELADEVHLPESRPRTLARRMSVPEVRVPAVITERYLADLSRQLTRARYTRARYLDEWDRILVDAVDTQKVLDSAASKRIEMDRASPEASIFDRLTILTPFTRYLVRYWFMPYIRMSIGVCLSLASICIVWSEFIKSINPIFSIVSVTVVHHPDSARGQIGFAGQVIAAFWISYMCVAALTSLTEVKVWRGRALVKRNTHGESAMWYAMQVAKLSVPLSFNFVTFLQPEIYEETVFYKFLGKLINLTPLGTWFDWFFPIFIFVPVFATLFNLYGKVKSCFGYGVMDEEDDEEESSFGSGSWREGRDLIERELQGALGRPGAGSLETRPRAANSSNRRSSPNTSASRVDRSRPYAAATAPKSVGANRREADHVNEEDETFFGSFSHRVRNTFETAQTPRWLRNVGEGMKRPKWMGGTSDDGGNAESSASSNERSFTSWFGGRQSGRVRL
ncbi:LMBR1-like membrane protein-domain-containing protein [Xylogone sp. PMI_703]|nr:LMBR1-like membrane protein-domain-containing protein [Xylogone sp. PMI_703]